MLYRLSFLTSFNGRFTRCAIQRISVMHVASASTKISKQEVLGLEVFKEYKATVKDESNGVSTTLDSNTKTTSTGGGCCGGGGSCGSGSGGGCGCGAK